MAVIGLLVFIYFVIVLFSYIVTLSISIIGGTDAYKNSHKAERRYFWECRKEVIVSNMFPFPDTIVVNKTDSDECEG